MKTTFIILFVFVISDSIAQNFILNPSFEKINECPTEYSLLNLAIPWESPSDGTPDLFHPCDSISNAVGVPINFMGNLYPKDGQSYAGIHFVFEDNYREYLKTELDDCMRAGETYELSFWVALSEIKNSPISSAFVGAHFSTEDHFFNRRNTIPLAPNVVFNDTFMIDSANHWVKMTANYTSTGSERYLIIGNFYPNSEVPFNSFKIGTYLFFDDLKLINPVNHFLGNCGKVICEGDSVQLAVNNLNGDFLEWQNSDLITFSTDSNIWVQPLQSTKYYLRINGNIVDSMAVQVNPMPKSHSELLLNCSEVSRQISILSERDFKYIHWSNGRLNSLINESNIDSGWVYLTNNLGCSDTLYFNLDTCVNLVCFGEYFLYKSDYTADSLKWVFEDNLDSIISNNSELNTIPNLNGTYYLLSNDERVDSVNVYIVPKKAFDIEVECDPRINEVRVINPYGSVLWSDGKDDSFTNRFYPGEHWVQLEDVFGCKNKKTFKIPDNCNSAVICPNDSVLLINPINGNGNWVSSSDSTSYFSDDFIYVKPENSGDFYFKSGEDILDTFPVVVRPDFEFEFEVSCQNELPYFKIINSNGKITWGNGRISILSQPLTEDNRWVEMLRSDGCVFREDLIYENSCKNSFGIDEIFVPNVITPNGDNKNDRFEIVSYLENIELVIYNSWGKKVYYSKPYENDWSAENLTSGYYFFQLSDVQLRENVKGWVRVIR